LRSGESREVAPRLGIVRSIPKCQLIVLSGFLNTAQAAQNRTKVIVGLRIFGLELQCLLVG
jgi:hypothetical protein